MLQAAEKNGWLVDRTGTQMTFMCPDVLLGKFMEPQILHCTEDENGYLGGPEVARWKLSRTSKPVSPPITLLVALRSVQ